ncbi:MAG: trypsin-like serine protease [Myxococcota bacterium]
MLLSSLAFAQDAPPIIGGETTSDFLAVGTLVVAYDGTIYDSFCSGTYIASRVVLTAAHCNEAALEFSESGYDIGFCVGSSLNTLEACDLAVYSIIHPGYTGSETDLQNDIALLELEAGITGLAPIALNTDSPSTFGTQDVTYVGWGITDYQQGTGGGVKRTVDIPFDSYTSQFIITYDPNNQKNLCSGDSGGAGLMWDNGQWEVVGVNSFVRSADRNDPCAGDFAEAGAARVDAYIDFIEEYVDFSEAPEDETPDDQRPDEEEEQTVPDEETEDPDEDLETGDTGLDEGPADALDERELLLGCAAAPSQTGSLLVIGLLAGALIRRRD